MRHKVHITVPKDMVAVAFVDHLSVHGNIIDDHGKDGAFAVDGRCVQGLSKAQDTFAVGAGGFRKNRDINALF